MAYNNFYPSYYPQQYPQNNNQQIQNGGFVSVRSEEEARNYPVAIGNSVTFHDETSAHVYTKTMGCSQFDRPVFKKYKLVEEDVEEQMDMGEINSVKTDIKKLWSEINALKNRKPVPKDKNGEA